MKGWERMMNMLIRSQDREILTNMDMVTDLIIEERSDNEYKIKAFYPNTDDGQSAYMYLADYTSKEKAIKVLDMIEEMYQKHIFTSGGAMAMRNLYVPPFGFIPPKVFKMPADDEVEV